MQTDETPCAGHHGPPRPHNSTPRSPCGRVCEMNNRLARGNSTRGYVCSTCLSDSASPCLMQARKRATPCAVAKRASSAPTRCAMAPPPLGRCPPLYWLPCIDDHPPPPFNRCLTLVVRSCPFVGAGPPSPSASTSSRALPWGAAPPPPPPPPRVGDRHAVPRARPRQRQPVHRILRAKHVRGIRATPCLLCESSVVPRVRGGEAGLWLPVRL